MKTLPVSVLRVACLLVMLSIIGRAHCTMDITAFEYYRKFKQHLELGECPQREVIVTGADNSSLVKPITCKNRQKGNITSLPRELNDTRHVIIPTANDLVAYLGLCGGEAASFLGILNNGDCVAVEIASKLSFSGKTLVRAYVEYYRKSLDILETTDSVPEGFAQYYTDKFYVKNRSYGTLEIILVQFRFQTKQQNEIARNLKLTSQMMSEYMKKVEREVGIPKSVKVLSLSTATAETYTLKKYDDNSWAEAVRDVELREMMVRYTRERIDRGLIMPHLNYQLFPFLAQNAQSYRTSSPLTWEKTSMLEVSLRQAVSIAKKTAKRCKKNRTKLCRRVRELRRKLVELQGKIHQGRSEWMNLTNDEKRDFATRYTAQVSTYSSVTKNLSRSVRRMKKEEKLERKSNTKKKRNQVPLSRRIRRLRLKRERSHRHRSSVKPSTRE